MNKTIKTRDIVKDIKTLSMKVNRKTDLDWIEWQAGSIAPRILMLKDQLELVAMKSLDANKRRYRSSEAYFHQVVTDLVSEFQRL